MSYDTKDWHVLLVEDEFDSLQMISKILMHHGIDVKVARDGQECIALLGTFTPTLVLMDLALPIMDGWETLAIMRASDKWAHIPVIAITAYHSVSVEVDAREAGFNAYLPKPIDTHHFLDNLVAVMEHHNQP
ncbi:MAG: response regulator [Anaerolineae bacterium]|nr:response regulator [Anaerolineae bacterium]MCA9894420.1 response regulator [Anaerolineae bacterium]MCB9459592.1 response regulator [Anaerolineaceae bacterium]